MTRFRVIVNDYYIKVFDSYGEAFEWASSNYTKEDDWRIEEYE